MRSVLLVVAPRRATTGRDSDQGSGRPPDGGRPWAVEVEHRPAGLRGRHPQGHRRLRTPPQPGGVNWWHSFTHSICPSISPSLLPLYFHLFWRLFIFISPSLHLFFLFIFTYFEGFSSLFLHHSISSSSLFSPILKAFHLYFSITPSLLPLYFHVFWRQFIFVLIFISPSLHLFFLFLYMFQLFDSNCIFVLCW